MLSLQSFLARVKNTMLLLEPLQDHVCLVRQLPIGRILEHSVVPGKESTAIDVGHFSWTIIFIHFFLKLILIGLYPLIQVINILLTLD